MTHSITRTPLLTAVLSPEKLVGRVEIKRIELSPKQKAGAHFHPCPVVGYIDEGAIYFQIENEEPKLLKVGDAFFEPANVNVLHFDNASEEHPVTFIAFYLLHENENELITMI